MPPANPREPCICGGCNPIHEHVDGSPFQPGDTVRVVRAVDVDIHDVSQFVGRPGMVEYLEYECGCGQQYPDVPMVGVRFASGEVEEFWPEEIEVTTREPAREGGQMETR